MRPKLSLSFAVAIVGVAGLAAVVRAEDPPKDPSEVEVEAVTAELDKQAAAAKDLKEGAPEAQKIIDELGKLGSRLYGVKDRSVKGWVDAVKRTTALEAKVYETASGQKMPAEPADDATKKAVELLDAADKELAGGATHDSQVPKVNEARKLLGGTEQRRNDLWPETAARADALVKGIRAAPAPKPPAQPDPPKPDAAKPDAPVGDKPAEPAYKLIAGERAPKAATPIKGGDKLTRVFYAELDQAGVEFAAMQPKDWADAKKVQSIRSLVSRMDKMLTTVIERIDGRHPDVAWMKGWVAAAKKKIDDGVASGKAAAEEHAKADKEKADKEKADRAKADADRVANATFKIEKGERPPKASEPLNSGVRSYFEDEVYREFDRVAGVLAKGVPSKPQDEVRDMRNALERAEKGLGRSPDQNHPDVLWNKGWIAEARKRIDAFEAEINKATAAADAAKAAEKKDVDARIEELRTFFDAKTFKTALEPPFTKDRVAEWIKNLKEWDKMSPKGLAEVQKIRTEHPTYAKDQRLMNLEFTFSKFLPKKIKEGIGRTVDWYETGNGNMQGYVLKALHDVEHYVEVPGGRGNKPSEITDDMLKDDDQATKLLKDFKAAVEGCECRIAYAKDYLGKPDTAYEALLPKLSEMHAKIEVAAKGLFENATMPKSDSDDASLIETAKTAFKSAREGYGPQGEWKRIVVNCKQSRETENKSTSWVEGEWIYTKKWTETYSYFQVCLAEKVGSDWRLVYYDMKNLDKEPGWYVAGRWVRNRIPEANIEK